MIKLLDFKKNSTLLRRAGKEVLPNAASSDEFLSNIEKMKEILAIDGVGLAATQVNWPVKLFMLCIDKDGAQVEPQIFVNPEIISYSKTEEKTEEGCLSFPSLFMKIKRPTSIKWRYQTLSGDEIVKESSGFYARAVQHETDHCNGRVFIDRASTIEKMKLKKWLKG